MMYTYAQGFQALGHETYSAIRYKNKYYPDSEYDSVLFQHGKRDVTILLRWSRMVLEAVTGCDLFVFAYASILPGFIDLPLLKRMGKKIIFTFLGSEVRSIDAFEKEMQLLGVVNEYQPFIDGIRAQGEEKISRKLRRICSAEKYADLILSQPGFAQLQKRPYMRVSVPLNLSRYVFEVPGREIPLILHAPSSPLTKGTPKIMEAIRQLQAEDLRFEFQLIENLPNADLRALLTKADILIDELYADSVGVLSAEGMATGNAVLTHYPEEYAKVPAGCPAVNITTDNLVNRLREVIVNQGLRRELAERGRSYVEKNNDHIQTARNMLDWVNAVDTLTYDFQPVIYNQLMEFPEFHYLAKGQ